MTKAKWITVKQAAEHMGVHPNSIYNARSKGEPMGKLFYQLPGTTTLRADLEEVDAYLKGGSK